MLTRVLTTVLRRTGAAAPRARPQALASRALSSAPPVTVRVWTASCLHTHVHASTLPV